MFIRYDEEYLWKLYDGFHKKYAGAPTHYLTYLETLNKTYMKSDVRLNQLFGDFTPLTTELARQLPEVYLPLPESLYGDIQKLVSDNISLNKDELVYLMDSKGLYIELKTSCTEHPDGGTVQYVRIPDAEFGSDFAIYQNKFFILNPLKFSPNYIFCSFILIDYRVLERVWGSRLKLPECPWQDKLTYRSILGDLLYSYFEGPIGGTVDILVRRVSNLRTMGVLTKRTGWDTDFGFLWKDKVLLDFDFVLAVNAFDITADNYDRLQATVTYVDTIRESYSNFYPIGLMEIEDENYGKTEPRLIPHVWFEDWDKWAKWLDEDTFKTDTGYDMDVQSYKDPVLKDKGERCDTLELTINSTVTPYESLIVERTERQTEPFLFDEVAIFDDTPVEYFDYNHEEGSYKEIEIVPPPTPGGGEQTTSASFNQIFQEITESHTDDSLSMDGEAIMVYKDTQNLRRYGTKDSATIDMLYGRMRYLMDEAWDFDGGAISDMGNFVMSPSNSYMDFSISHGCEAVEDEIAIEKKEYDGSVVGTDTSTTSTASGMSLFTQTLQSPPHEFYDLPLVDREHAYAETREVVNFPY